MALMRKRRVLAAALETTLGTAETVDAADALLVYDPTMRPAVEFEERDGPGSASPLPSARGSALGTCSFAIDLAGSGDDVSPIPTWASVLLPACRMVNSSGETFTPSSAAPAASDGQPRTVTLALYEDGRRKLIYGAMGTFSVTADAGKRVRLEFEFTGIWAAPTDAAMLTPTITTAAPPRFASAGLTVATYAARVAQVTLALNNSVEAREDVSAAEGVLQAIAAPGRITGQVDPEASLVASFNPFDKLTGETTAALSWSIGAGGDGNTIAFSVPAAQFTEIDDADRKGLATDPLSFLATRSTAAGDDELAITFS